MSKPKRPNPSDPPANGLWGFFAAGNWDHEYARNVLLHYLTETKQAEKCLKWLDRHYPKGWDE